MKVLFSIKPMFAEKILSGEKKYEFRRVIYKNPDITSIVIYASAPIQKIIGEFDVNKVIELHPDFLWKRTSKDAGIDRKYFDEYFKGKEVGFAIKVNNPKRYSSPKNLSYYGIKKPPQSFCYI